MTKLQNFAEQAEFAYASGEGRLKCEKSEYSACLSAPFN